MLIEWFCTFLYKMIVYTVIMTHFFTCCEATVNVNCTAVCIYQNLLWNLNRYDLLCVEGISRGIQVFLGKWVLLTVFKTEAVGLALETGFCLRVSVYLLSVFQEYTTLQVGKVFPKKPKDPTSFPDFSPTLRLEEE